MDYGKLIKTAYRMTTNHPGLWFFGLFLAGGFNINVIYFLTAANSLRPRFLLPDSAGDLTSLVLGAVVLFIIGVIVINWFKILFVLRAADLAGIPRLRPPGLQNSSGPDDWRSLARQALVHLPRVTTMSLFTIVIMLAVSSALWLPLRGWQLLHHPGLVTLALAVFMGLNLITALLNIFTGFFVMLFHRNLHDGLNLALDLLFRRWLAILEMTLLLVFLYGLSLVGALAILAAARSVMLDLISGLGVLAPTSLLLTRGLEGLCLWAWLAFIHVFFNLALLLLFSRLVKPIEQADLAPVAVTSTP